VGENEGETKGETRERPRETPMILIPPQVYQRLEFDPERFLRSVSTETHPKLKGLPLLNYCMLVMNVGDQWRATV